MLFHLVQFQRKLLVEKLEKEAKKMKVKTAHFSVQAETSFSFFPLIFYQKNTTKLHHHQWRIMGSREFAKCSNHLKLALRRSRVLAALIIRESLCKIKMLFFPNGWYLKTSGKYSGLVPLGASVLLYKIAILFCLRVLSTAHPLTCLEPWSLKLQRF